MPTAIESLLESRAVDLDRQPFAVVWFKDDTVEFDVDLANGLHPIQVLLALDDIGRGAVKVAEGFEQHRFGGHPCLLLLADDLAGPITRGLACGLSPFQGRSALRALRLYADWLFEGAFQANLQQKMNRQPGLYLPNGTAGPIN